MTTDRQRCATLLLHHRSLLREIPTGYGKTKTRKYPRHCLLGGVTLFIRQCHMASFGSTTGRRNKIQIGKPVGGTPFFQQPISAVRSAASRADNRLAREGRIKPPFRLYVSSRKLAALQARSVWNQYRLSRRHHHLRAKLSVRQK